MRAQATSLGHPIHPMLIVFPLGLFPVAVMCGFHRFVLLCGMAFPFPRESAARCRKNFRVAVFCDTQVVLIGRLSSRAVSATHLFSAVSFTAGYDSARADIPAAG
jgi:hypothetical protein